MHSAKFRQLWSFFVIIVMPANITINPKIIPQIAVSGTVSSGTDKPIEIIDRNQPIMIINGPSFLSHDFIASPK